MRELILSLIIFLMFIGLVFTGVAPLIGGTNPHAVYFEKHLETVIFKLQEKDFKGPIGPIMAQRALSRQILEDGRQKTEGRQKGEGSGRKTMDDGRKIRTVPNS